MALMDDSEIPKILAPSEFPGWIRGGFSGQDFLLALP